jgi:hypothetical protein
LKISLKQMHPAGHPSGALMPAKKLQFKSAAAAAARCFAHYFHYYYYHCYGYLFCCYYTTATTTAISDVVCGFPSRIYAQSYTRTYAYICIAIYIYIYIYNSVVACRSAFATCMNNCRQASAYLIRNIRVSIVKQKHCQRLRSSMLMCHFFFDVSWPVAVQH